MALGNPSLIAREANELAVGLLGIGLTLLIQKIFLIWRNRALQRRFPVAGTYITKYIDQGCTNTDMVRLKQAGLKIFGHSVPNLEKNIMSRKWIFEGEIRDEGYVQGTYKPEAYTDKGFGAFFLRFEKNGDMRGYWIGKDADESHIVSGEYNFFQQPGFTQSPIETSDVADVLRIAEDRLGDAYIDPADLKVNEKTVAYCARVQGKVVSFATARILETATFVHSLHNRMSGKGVNLIGLERRLAGQAQIGFVASAATDQRFEGRGLGAELIGQCIAGLESRGANVLIATAWKSKNGVQAGTILECRGFQRLLELPDYWEKDSVAHGYSCPTCGAPPCHCNAILYVRSRHALPAKK